MSNEARVGVGGSRWRAAVRAAAGLIVAAGSTGGPGVAPGVAAAAQPPAAEGGFTADQAAAGWSVYARQCGECHGARLDGAEAPPLRGVDFLNGWAGQTTDELFAYVRDEMPPGLGGSLGDQVYLNLVAYLLDMNGAGPATRRWRRTRGLRSATRRTWPRRGGRRGRAAGRGGGRRGSSTGRCPTI